jgi:D-glycero-alpha-D-manno-heptose-7-phosphate kinase
MKTIKVKAPVRIDFAGGWTDVPPYCEEVGGTVVNATIDKYVEGKFVIDEQDRITVQYRSDIPISSGLGTSATMNVVWLKLVKSQVENFEIAEKSFWLEKLLGIAGGRQDQYASAIGGINYMTFNMDQIHVSPIAISPSFIQEMEKNMVLCYTGKSRLSSNIIMVVMKNFKEGNPETIAGLTEIRTAAQKMKPALEKGNLKEFAELINLNWDGQKKLSPEVSTTQIESLFRLAYANGAIAGKACGAGGGGSLLFIGDKKKITTVLKDKCQIIPFHFDFTGLQIQIQED